MSVKVVLTGRSGTHGRGYFHHRIDAPVHDFKDRPFVKKRESQETFGREAALFASHSEKAAVGRFQTMRQTLLETSR